MVLGVYARTENSMFLTNVIFLRTWSAAEDIHVRLNRNSSHAVCKRLHYSWRRQDTPSVFAGLRD